MVCDSQPYFDGRPSSSDAMGDDTDYSVGLGGSLDGVPTSIGHGFERGAPTPGGGFEGRGLGVRLRVPDRA